MHNETTPIEICNHTSVGMIVFNEQHHLLLIERRKFPYGYACPAGHVDNGETYQQAALRELREEVGLEVVHLDCVLDELVENTCRRPYGDWHRWKVYEVQAMGRIGPNLSEAKQAGWFDPSQLAAFARKTERYRAGAISEALWQEQPGLEPVWYDFLSTLDMLPTDQEHPR
jgi:ADP-ribose pyrophosphatase YjhB (NUDIX family)